MACGFGVLDFFLSADVWSLHYRNLRLMAFTVAQEGYAMAYMAVDILQHDSTDSTNFVWACPTLFYRKV